MFGMSWADTFRVLLMGLFILVCLAIAFIVIAAILNINF